MRQLETNLIRARGVLRRARSRMATTDPESVTPARLVLRFDDRDLPGSIGDLEPMDAADWHQAIVQMVQWVGPVPVTVIATHSSDEPLVTEVIRFAHRMECPTTLVTAGAGIDKDQAEKLLDVGLSSVRFLVGGVSDGVQTQTVGNTAQEATTAVTAFIQAKRARNSNVDIEIVIPWVNGVTRELTAIVGWAKQAGVDGFRIVAPYMGTDLPADPELLDDVVDAADVFCRNPIYSIDELHTMVAHQDGRPGISREKSRRRFKCPVGGQRIVVGAQRSVFSCPFHKPIGSFGGELREVWSEAGNHLSEIASCERVCVHTELAPEPIFG